MLREYQPCLPIRALKAPSGRWVHEIKHDGYRLIVRKVGKMVRLYTKNGHDWAERYPLIVDAVSKLRVTSLVLDGEAMCFGDGGSHDFDALWNRCNDQRAEFCSFDLLELNGEDFRPKPLVERKKRLAKLLAKDRHGLQFVEHLEGEGQIIFEHACKLGLEGIVSKRLDGPYRAGPSKSWIKVKNTKHPAILRVKEAYERDRWRGRRG